MGVSRLLCKISRIFLYVSLFPTFPLCWLVFQESLVRSWKRQFDTNDVMETKWLPCWWSSAWTSSAAGVYERKGSSVCLDKPTSSKSFRMLSTVERSPLSTGTCSKYTYSLCYEYELFQKVVFTAMP